MNILFFVGSLNAGGAERVATTLAHAWAARGHRVTLVVTHLESDHSFYPLHPDVRVVWLGLHMSRLAGRHAKIPAKLWVMRRLIRHVRPDVVLAFLTNVNINVLMAATGMDVPVVVGERTNPVHGEAAGRLLQMLRRRLYPRARAVVVQTQAGIADMHATVPGLQHVHAIANPLPPALSTSAMRVPAQATRRSGRGRMQVVAMGRLVPSKQFDQLIQAFARVAPQHPGWDLVIWGEGPCRPALQVLIDSLALADRVRLAGVTQQPWEVLADAQLFAMTSRVEGFPNVLLEAMALGLPAIVADCPSGPAEMTRQGELARLVPLEDAPGLVAALHELMSDAVLRERMGTQAAQDVQLRYALETILEQWDTVFQSVIHSSPCA